MLYKEDWPEAQERLRAWWKGEIIDRPCIQVTAPRKEPIEDIKPLAVPEEIARLGTNHWYAWALNPEYALNRAEMGFARTYYGGESIPYQLITFGPDMMAAYLGIEPQFAQDTTWFKPPLIKSWDNQPYLRYHASNKWWQITRRLAEVLTEGARGKFLVGIADLSGGLDTLSSLRGPDNLLLDMIEHPEEIKKLLDDLHVLWLKYYEEIYQITQRGQTGSVSWLGPWSPGRWYPVQCDFAYMISPVMFKEFVLPYLKEQCRYLEHSIYHLDGKGQLVHLNLLLDLPELTGIQWSVPVVPDDPPHDSLEWLPYFKRIQKAGKLLHLWARPENIESLLSKLSPRGLLINTCCDSVEEAKELLERVMDWRRAPIRRKR